MAWKTVAVVLDADGGRPASMGPRFNGVEDHQIERHQHGVGGASMGPRFNGVEDLSAN